jgi:WD40 repeat protein
MRFVLRHYSTIAEWPLQIYSSALLFTPEASIIRRGNLGKVPSWLKKLPEVEKVWSPLIQTLNDHSSWVTAVAFSHDGAQLASASRDKTIKLWDTTTGELRKTLKGHSSSVTAVAFSHDGAQLASASHDETIKLWDPTTGELRTTLKGHSSSVTAVAFSHDGAQLASASDDKTIKLWDPSLSTLQRLFSKLGVSPIVGPEKTIPLTACTKSLAYSTNACYLNTDGGTIKLISMAGNRRDDITRTELLLSAKDQWIYGDKSRIVRLPREHALECFDSHEDVVVVGCSNGSLLRFEIDRLRLCSEMSPGRA